MVWRPSPSEVDHTPSGSVVFCKNCHYRTRLDGSNHHCGSPDWDTLAREWYAWTPSPLCSVFTISQVQRREQLKEDHPYPSLDS